MKTRTCTFARSVHTKGRRKRPLGDLSGLANVGDRAPGDSVRYPDDGIQAALGPDGKWSFTRKDDSPS